MKEQKDKFLKNLNTSEKITLGILLLIAIGIGLTYIPWREEEVQPTFVAEAVGIEKPVVTEGMTYEQQLETKLGAILQELEGAGKTSVMVTTSATDEKVLAEEVVECIEDTTQTDPSGNTKSDSKQDITKEIVMQKGDTPIVLKENRAEIEGVLVLAEGAGDSNVKAAITQAVSSVLDVPVHKIAVFKMAEN